MAVFNPGSPNLTGAYGQIQDILAKRASLESTRPQLGYGAGETAFKTIEKVGDRNREAASELGKEQRKQDFEREKIELEAGYEERKTILQEELKKQLDEQKAAREAKESEKQRAHERRGEKTLSADEVLELEQELDLEEGMLSELRGRSLKQDDIEKVITNAHKKMVARIKGEPDANAVVSSMGNGDNQVLYGMTREFSKQKSRLQKQLVGAGGNDVIKDISSQEFPSGPNGGITPTQLKGRVLQKALTSGFDSLTPEEAALIAEDTADPAMTQAIKVYGASQSGLGKGPDELYGEVSVLANQFREDMVKRANSEKVLASKSPKARANFNTNVDNAVKAIQDKSSTYEEIMAAIEAQKPDEAALYKKMIDQKLKRK